MGTDSTAPTLFDQLPEKPGVSESALTPSEEFMLAHAEFLEPVHGTTEWDPNARRSKQLEGVGGGLKSAIDGELQVIPVSINRTLPVRRTRRNYESRHGDSERSYGTPDYYNEPYIPTDDVRQIGKRAIAGIREELAIRKSAKAETEKES